MRKNNFFDKLNESKIFWAIVSLILSVSFWVYITGMETEEFKKTFRGVRVEFVGEDILRNSKNMVITDLDTSTVTVSVTGPRRIVASLDSADIVANVDVSMLNHAAYTSQQYNIVFPDGTDTSGLDVSMRIPETVNFMVSNQTSKTIQVRGSFDGSLSDGYTAQAPEFQPSVITISGPDAYIRNVSYAWVSFGSENISSSFSVDTGFNLMNENGEECSTEFITCSEDIIHATLPILEVKNVSLAVELTGISSYTAANTIVKIEPESISLAGDSAILAGLNKIVLKTIDASDFVSTFSDTFTIPIDNNLINLTGITEAKVSIEIVGMESKSFRVSNISCINVTEGYEAEVNTEYIDVILRGTKEQLDAILSENLRAVADLIDYKESAGSFMPPVRIFIDGSTDVDCIGDYSVNVLIRKGG